MAARAAPLRTLVAITSSKHPYILDLPHVLSLPSGFEYRFRYRYRWISEELRGAIAHRHAELVGSRLLILFHSLELHRLVPIRFGTVLAIERIGPLVYVRFRLGAFAPPPVDALHPRAADELLFTSFREERERLANDYGRLGFEAVAKAPWRLDAPLPDGEYLAWRTVPEDLSPPEFFGTAIPDPILQSRSWANVAAAVVDEPALKGIPLFFVVGFQDSSDRFATLEPVHEWGRGLDDPSTRLAPTVFGLREGVRYRLRLVEWSEQLGSARLRVTTKVSPPVVQLEGASDLVVGAYDILEFTFVAVRPGTGELLSRAEVVGEGEAPEEPLIFTARVPIQVRHDWRRIALMVLLAGVGIYLAASPPGGFDWLRLIGAALASFAAGSFLERLFQVRDIGEGAEKLARPAGRGASDTPTRM